jgi:glycosyltransferase involved in cell wall biosynthesis
MPTISVIVPVYNAEKYLNRCLDSLLAQTYQDFELLLVNDGSSDNSGIICERYAQRDERISVFHQQNQGVAAARQRGIDMASGAYSIHVDPDDWVEPTMLEEIYAEAKASNADMVICDFLVEYSQKTQYASQRVRKCNAEYCLSRMMSGRIHGSLCNKLIRTELYKKYDIRFHEGINYCEDYLICVQLFLRGVKISYLPKAFYHYDQIVNENSATRKLTKDIIQMRLRFFDILCNLLGKSKSRALSHVISVIAFDCYYYDVLPPKEFAEIFGRYRTDFMRSKYKFKRRIALYMAASGYLKQAQKIA